MKKLIRKLIPLLPKGKTLAINLTLKLFGRKVNDIIRVDNRNFYIDQLNDLNRSLFFLGQYEPEITKFIKQIISQHSISGGWTALDIGANFGWYSTLFAQYGAKVYAFEASRQIADQLTKTIAANYFNFKPTLEIMAIGDQVKSISCFYSEEQGNSNLSEMTECTSVESVLMTDLDSYVEKNNIGKIDFIKCDIDGAELLFLEGAKKVLAKKPAMIIEWVYNQEEILKELAQYGYKFILIESNTMIDPANPPKGVAGNLYCY